MTYFFVHPNTKLDLSYSVYIRNVNDKNDSCNVMHLLIWISFFFGLLCVLYKAFHRQAEEGSSPPRSKDSGIFFSFTLQAHGFYSNFVQHSMLGTQLQYIPHLSLARQNNHCEGFYWNRNLFHKVALKRKARHWPRSRAPRDPCGRYRTPIVTVTHTFDFSSQLVAASFKYFTIVYVVTDCSSIPARHSVTVVRLRHSTQSHNTPLSSLLNKYLQNNVGLLFFKLLLRLPQAQVPCF